MRGVLNSGFEFDGAVIRVMGDDHEVRAYRTFCPTVIACIGKLPGTIEDRSIVIRMRRRHRGEAIERLRSDNADLRVWGRMACRWAADHLQELTGADPEMPAELHDRAADCWRPLLAIADVAGGDWPLRARAAAIAMSGEETDIDSASVLLLKDIHEISQGLDNGSPSINGTGGAVARLGGSAVERMGSCREADQHPSRRQAAGAIRHLPVGRLGRRQVGEGIRRRFLLGQL